ncbi:glycosyltransferase family 61 protein [Xanthocytophaga agilis]|uniref:glycosyltransferase family 61 protein n=1 Tax=Xanthocytophaga agilis TaxID=3048010 RepID=UPI0028D2A346|nr:glycosyltransferase family 61 protein [Xanthocytophaga agilis]
MAKLYAKISVSSTSAKFIRLVVSKITDGSFNYFKVFNPDSKQLYFYYRESPKPSFFEEGIGYLNPAIQEQFRSVNKSYTTHIGYLSEYVFVHRKPCIIEPKQGWAIDIATDQLIYPSIPYQSLIAEPYPSWIGYHFRSKKDLLIDIPIISLRMMAKGWLNYWHVFGDLLGQLILLDRLGISQDIPILIPEETYHKPFFQEMLKRSKTLSERKWILQDRYTFVKTNEVYFVQKMPFSKEQFDGVLDYLNIPEINADGELKLYLTRKVSRGRYLVNALLIETIAKEYGFEIVDCDDLDFNEQISYFSKARYIVGLHGAGLTNIIFRRGGELNLLEIFPGNYAPNHYYWLSKTYAYSYDAIIGSSSIDGSFEIDPVLFREKLDSFFNF